MAISDLTKLWNAHNRAAQVDQDGLTEEYKCPWADRLTSISELMGSAHSDLSHLRCTSIGVTPLGDVDDTSGGPNQAKLSVGWETRKLSSQEVNSDWTTWQEHWQTSGEAITIGEGFQWVSDDKAVTDEDASGVKIFPAATITITGTVNTFNANAKTQVVSMQGLVNDGSVTIKGFVYSDSHLLFEGLDANEGTDGAGNTVYQLTYKFAYKHLNSWNEFWRKDKAGGPAFDTMSDSGGSQPYDKGDFSANLDPSNW